MAKGGSKKIIVTYGGWYQRTTLHLSEIYDFLAYGTSKLPLDAAKLKANRASLKLRSVSRQSSEFEFVEAKTRLGIKIRYYEDGLYILELESSSITTAQKILQEYFEQHFNPAIGYIFSLGAPTPKVLANIKSTHPIVVAVSAQDPSAYKINENLFGKIYQQISHGGTHVYKTASHIFIVSTPDQTSSMRALIESHIFFREFKDQLGKYLQIHRTLWEEIAAIKDKKKLKANETDAVRAQLDSYEVTIDLITNRMNQMGSYVRTRAALAKKFQIDKSLSTLFQYHFEVLLDTLDYMKEIWKMTIEYLHTAIAVVVEIQNQGTKASIQSLTAITTFGVIATVVTFMKNATGFTFLNYTSIVALVLMILAAWCLDQLIKWRARNHAYDLNFSERSDKL